MRHTPDVSLFVAACSVDCVEGEAPVVVACVGVAYIGRVRQASIGGGADDADMHTDVC